MIEDVILNKLFTCKEFYATASEYIVSKPDIFEEANNRLLAKYLMKFIHSKNARPTFDDVLLYLENDTDINDKEYEKIITMVNNVRKNNYDITIENLKEETLKHVKSRLTMTLLEKGALILGGLDKKNTLESIQLEMREIVDMEFDEDMGVSLDDYEIFKEYGQDIVPFNFKPFDDLLAGGAPKGTMNVILATPHTGKSQLKMFLAVQSAISGKKVTYISGEMDTRMTRQRIDSIILKIATTKLNEKYLGYKEYIKRYDEIKKGIQGNIYVKYFSSSTASANRVSKYLQDLRNKKNYVTDLLVVDSINLMCPIDTRIPKTQKHIYMECITIDFREMIQKENVTLLTSAQINKEGEKACKNGDDLDMTVIGEFYMLGGFADSIIGLKNMYKDDEMLFNDYYKNKAVDECLNDEINLSGLYKEYFDVAKLNVIKCRYGSVVGAYSFLGSKKNISSFIDLNAGKDKPKPKYIKPNRDTLDEVNENLDSQVEKEKNNLIENHNIKQIKTFGNRKRII